MHLWIVRLDVPRADVERQLNVLCEDERDVAGRFRFEADRRRFVVSHEALRRVLGGYLDLAPQDVRFATRRGGKPSVIAAGPGRPAPSFSLSRSHEVALCAIGWGRAVGVDVERLRDVDHEALAEHVCSTAERAELRSLPEVRRSGAFLACWTCKEAYLKATGDGLSRPPASCEVSLRPGRRAVLRAVAGDRAVAARCHLRALRPARGYVGALAVDGPACRIVWRRYSE